MTSNVTVVQFGIGHFFCRSQCSSFTGQFDHRCRELPWIALVLTAGPVYKVLAVSEDGFLFGQMVILNPAFGIC